MRIGLVGCVKTKQFHRAAARDLYTSALFHGRRAHVEASCDCWFVLSAEHGLVDPDTELDPYDETLKEASRAARRAWSASVLAALSERLGDLRGHVFEIHAGSDYRDWGLVEGLRAAGAAVEVPAAGLSQGQQLAFYARGRHNGVSFPKPSDPARPVPTPAPRPSSLPSGTYAALGHYLAGARPPVTLIFVDIERVIGRPLPASARRHRPWWANDPSHSQARAWLGAGWRVLSVDLNAGRVTFGS
jgi:hypothetical protein